MVPVGANAIVEEGAYKEIHTLANTSDEPDKITLSRLPAMGENIAAIGEGKWSTTEMLSSIVVLFSPSFPLSLLTLIHLTAA
jgi:hypothetical protein